MDDTKRITKTFTDVRGDVWRIAVNVGTGRRVKEATGFDLIEATRGKTLSLEQIADDPYLMGAVLWTLCERQAAEREVDEYDFAERLANADVLDDALMAVMEAVADFFPADSRPLIQRLVQTANRKVRARRTNDLTAVQARMETAEFDQQLDAWIDSQFSNSASNSPESPA